MSGIDDLKSHALSGVDFYTLLSLDPAADQKGLDRAWRRTALKYHPDKVSPADADAAREKFHLASIGYELLSDATLRALYDRTRAARELRERQRQQLEAGRRAAREDLEARERTSAAAKRSAGEAFGFFPQTGPSPAAPTTSADEDALEREITRLAQDGRRRREALQEKLRRQEKEAAETMRSATPEETPQSAMHTATNDPQAPSKPIPAPPPASELDRTVKAQFARSETADLSIETFETLFRDAFGDVEYAFERESKKKKKKKKRRKNDGEEATEEASHEDIDIDAPSPERTIVLTFTSLLGAHGAVERWARQSDALWTACRGVYWAAGKEPAAVAAWGNLNSSNASTSTSTTGPSGPSANNGNGSTNGHHHHASTAARLAQLHATGGATGGGAGQGADQDAAELKGTKKRFGSFAPPATTLPADTKSQNPFVGHQGAPSLEELTLMRLRHAEKRKAEANKLLASEEGEEDS